MGVGGRVGGDTGVCGGIGADASGDDAGVGGDIGGDGNDDDAGGVDVCDGDASGVDGDVGVGEDEGQVP